MKRTKFMRENKAVAGVIEALLMVALVAIILSMIQLYYIPQIMEQKEADHMDDVTNQFSFLKAMIDFQSMTEEDVPISSPITLGSKALPYFVTMPASGQLNVIGMDNNEYEINVDFGAKVFPLTSIKYEAFNFYYIDQIYALEGGCIIVNQSDGETVRVEPAITVENQTNVNIYYDIPIIMGVSGKNSTSGYKNCFIRTNYSHSDTGPGNDYLTIADVQNISIFTAYTSAWAALMEELLEENVNIVEQPTYVEITKKTKQINLYYREIYIYAQISPGWIK